MKTLIFVSILLLVFSACKKDEPIPGSDDGTSVYTDPYSDPTYDPDPDPDPDPYYDPGDPGDPSDPSDPSDPDDPGYTDGSSVKHSRHKVNPGRTTSFYSGSQANGAAGK